MEITFRLYVSFVTSPRLKILIWTDTENEDQYSERFWVKSVKIQVFPSPTGCWHLSVSIFECKVYSESRFLYKDPQSAESLELESGPSIPIGRISRFARRMRTSQYSKRLRLPTLHTWCADIPAPILIISAWYISSIRSLLFHFCFLVSISSRVTDLQILDRSVPCEPTCRISAHVQILLYTNQKIFCLQCAYINILPRSASWWIQLEQEVSPQPHFASWVWGPLANETLEDAQQTPLPG